MIPSSLSECQTKTYSTSGTSDTEGKDQQEKVAKDSSRYLPLAEDFLKNDCTQEELAKSLFEHYQWHTPVILRNVITGSAACRKWKDLEYLEKAVGEDTFCEVELGNGYNDPNMSKPRIPFQEYIQYIRLFENLYGKRDKNYDDSKEHLKEKRPVMPNSEELVYLAQNEVFKGLESDFSVPHFCSDPTYNIGAGSLHHTMIWFGPFGTISPLHYDPLDNLLMQIVGTKQVILYPPVNRCKDDGSAGFHSSPTDISGSSMRINYDDKNWYYTGSFGQQYNTSPIDVEDPDFDKYPNFEKAPPGLSGVLMPGDILFIPKKWMHHVRSLETSISVNSWWR